jgi:hypothetical protein
MTTMASEKSFGEKYQDAEKIWSGKGFIYYLEELKDLLAELPISPVVEPAREYTGVYPGNLAYVYGELMYCLTGYEGFLRDKAFPLQECFIRPIFKPRSTGLELGIRYKTKQGEELTWSCEVIREGATSYILFADYYRPL